VKLNSHNKIFAFLAGLLFFFISGCHMAGGRPVISQLQYSRLLSVPPVDFGVNRCGISAVQGILAYYNQLPIKGETGYKAYEDIKKMRLHDTLLLLRILRHAGIRAELGTYTMEQLVADSQRGNPTIILVPSSYGPLESMLREIIPSHCWVFLGTLDSGRLVCVNTPGQGPDCMPYEEFMTAWNGSGRAAIRTMGSATIKIEETGKIRNAGKN
jgi:hypothetical protein